jgi:hypothetical protein
MIASMLYLSVYRRNKADKSEKAMKRGAEKTAPVPSGIDPQPTIVVIPQHLSHLILQF